MANKITNIKELQAEKIRLKLLIKEQESYLGDQYLLLSNKVEAPFRFVRNLVANVPGIGLVKNLISSASNKGDDDWVTKVFRLASTAVLDRVFLRKAGLLKRFVFGLLSQQAAGVINKENISELITKVTDLVKPEKKRGSRVKKKDDDYGIPPFSESY